MSLVFVRILLVSLLCESAFGAPRVNQGKEITIEDAPYMARVRIKVAPDDGGACDGSILSDIYILTAGHCVTDESNINVPNPPLFGPSNFSILIGTGDLDHEERGEVFLVSKVIFREYSSKNDLAILKLSSRIKLNGITKMAVTLPANSNYKPRNRTNAYVDGWGTNPQNSEILLRSDIYTISVQECDTGADAGRDRSHQICTLGDNGAGPCKGDSGGPMLRADDGVQIGIVSLVPGTCENPGSSIATFTSVAANLNWIRRVMLQDAGDNQVEGATASTSENPTTASRPSSGGMFSMLPIKEILSQFQRK